MTKKLVGLFASVALLGSGVALADDWKKQDDKQAGSVQQPGSASGGSGEVGNQGGSKPVDQGATGQGQMGQQQGQVGQQAQVGQDQGEQGSLQLTGTVVKSSTNLLHLRTDSGIVPLKVTRSTKFDDPSVKRAKDLKEGQQVRANFNISGTDNVVTNISLSSDAGSDTGGSGLDQPMDSDSGINQPIDPPMNDGSGGSGLGTQNPGDLGGDVGGAGGNLGDDSATDSMGGDTNKGDTDY
jgi:hypothetical protein